jgi:hypothetical protein
MNGVCRRHNRDIAKEFQASGKRYHIPLVKPYTPPPKRDEGFGAVQVE